MDPLTVAVSIISSGLFSVLVTFVTNLWLEKHKAKLELASKDEAKRRQLYDEISTLVEDTFGSGENLSRLDISLKMNKIFGKLALYAPDDVYRELKDALIDKGIVFGGDAKPIIYCALRRSLFGGRTKMKRQDFVPHIAADHIPEEQAKSLRRIS